MYIVLVVSVCAKKIQYKLNLQQILLFDTRQCSLWGLVLKALNILFVVLYCRRPVEDQNARC